MYNKLEVSPKLPQLDITLEIVQRRVANLPLPRAINWSPSRASLVNSLGSHCMSCSEVNPRMAQLVRIATNTMVCITSNHTPMSLALCVCVCVYECVCV